MQYPATTTTTAGPVRVVVDTASCSRRGQHTDEDGTCNEPISNTEKLQQQGRMMLLVLVPFATLLAVTLYMSSDSISAMFQSQHTQETIEFSVFVGRLIVVLQKEQDQSVLHLSSAGSVTQLFLAQTYEETNEYLQELPYWPVGLDRSDRRYFDSRDTFQRYIQDHRDHFEKSHTSVYREIMFYKEIIDVFLIWLYDALKESKYSNLWKTLVSYQKVITCHQYAGMEKALGTNYFVAGGFSEVHFYIKYNEVSNVVETTFHAASKYSPLVKPISQYDVMVNGEQLTDVMEKYRDKIQFQNITSPSLSDASVWSELMSTYIDVLFGFESNLAEGILKILRERSSSLFVDVIVSSMVIGIVIISLPITLRLLYNLTNDIQSHTSVLSEDTRVLNQEKSRTDALFHQMLPKAVADRLKTNGRVADYFSEVTIFFSDIPGFTKMASQMAPLKIVCMLNYLYTRYDSRIDKYDTYKVETIRDTYMVVSGMLKPSKWRHATEIADLALDLMSLTRQLDLSHLDVPMAKIDLRIGIHSGPVVAGVVGYKLPRYCLFGDAVNTASRIKSHGLPNRIHMSKTTMKLLEKFGRNYVIESRGKVNLKGKGSISAYWLHGKNTDDGRPPPTLMPDNEPRSKNTSFDVLKNQLSVMTSSEGSSSISSPSMPSPMFSPMPPAMQSGMHTPMPLAMQSGMHTPMPPAMHSDMHTPMPPAMQSGMHTPMSPAMQSAMPSTTPAAMPEVV